MQFGTYNGECPSDLVFGGTFTAPGIPHIYTFTTQVFWALSFENVEISHRMSHSHQCCAPGEVVEWGEQGFCERSCGALFGWVVHEKGWRDEVLCWQSMLLWRLDQGKGIFFKENRDL